MVRRRRKGHASQPRCPSPVWKAGAFNEGLAMHNRRGATLLDVVASATMIAAAGAAGLVNLDGERGSVRNLAMRHKDASHLRGIVQGMVVFAMSNKDQYPLPSVLDGENTTVIQTGAAKDTSNHLMSILVYNSLATVEMMVSPAEVNPSIGVAMGYEHANPAKAVKPEAALWDPGLAADFGVKRRGNLSYAHLQPSGPRRARWSATFNAREIVLSTRGPEIRDVVRAEDGSVTPVLATPNNYAMHIHGDGERWSGLAAFNDNHVEFGEDRLAANRPVGLESWRAAYGSEDGRRRPDLWCFDEPDEAKGANNMLGIFIEAGGDRWDFKGAWDGEVGEVPPVDATTRTPW
jgi:hypothetical protein